jgi:hypothetical protein
VATANPASGATSQALAVTNDSYFSFTITPAYGKKMGFTTLTLSAARINANTPTGYGIRSSIDNYATNLATANLATARFTFTSVSLDLNAGTYQNLITAVTFRIYAFAPATTDGVDFDTIALNGFVTAG